MSLTTAIADRLTDMVEGTVYVGGLPAKPRSQNAQWAVIAQGGGDPEGGNILLWRQVATFQVRYRHKDGASIYEADGQLRAALAAPWTFEEARVLSVTTSPVTDTDEDAEGRHTASWTVQVTLLIA